MSLWVLIWVITSQTYGPTTSTGSQVFHSKNGCLEAQKVLVEHVDGVKSVCVEDVLEDQK